MIDAIFYTTNPTTKIDFGQSKKGKRILASLLDVVAQGYRQRFLQSSPHLVLLNTEFYEKYMKPVMAQWAMLYIETQHVCNSESAVKPEDMYEYIVDDRRRHSDALKQLRLRVERLRLLKRIAIAGTSVVVDTEGEDDPAKLPEAERAYVQLKEKNAQWQQYLDRVTDNIYTYLPTKHVKILNLARDYLKSYLPHIIQKIDRVSYGILSASDIAKLLAEDPNMPVSRTKLVVPFVGTFHSRSLPFSIPLPLFSSPSFSHPASDSLSLPLSLILTLTLTLTRIYILFTSPSHTFPPSRQGCSFEVE